MNANKYAQSVEQAYRGAGADPHGGYWKVGCEHGMSWSFSWKCPACAREVMARLKRKIAAYQFAAKVRRTCGKRR